MNQLMQFCLDDDDDNLITVDVDYDDDAGCIDINLIADDTGCDDDDSNIIANDVPHTCCDDDAGCDDAGHVDINLLLM